MATLKIKEVALDGTTAIVILEIDDGAGLVMTSNVPVTYEQYKDITSWTEFLNTLLKPAALPLIEKFQKVRAVGTILTSKIGLSVTI